MDGLKDTVPLGKPYEEFHQMSLFDMFPGMSEEEQEPELAPCRIYNWRQGNSLLFRSFKSRVLIAAKVSPFAFALSDLTAFLII